MKINSKFLSLPPHISTAWKNITSIQVIVDNGINVLAILLNDSNVIKIPGLSQEVIENIFASHSEYLEDSSNESGETELQNMAANLGIPLQFGMDGFQGFGAMQHNPEQADAPDIPQEVLSKITQVAEALGMEGDTLSIPEAEPHCNCTFCQVARAMKGDTHPEEVESYEEEEVSDKDLTFKEFDIVQKSEQVYEVTNPLDTSEHFQVFLGTPVGCTCGKKDCAHIKAVLNS